jgi:hypothetical protein
MTFVAVTRADTGSEPEERDGTDRAASDATRRGAGPRIILRALFLDPRRTGSPYRPHRHRVALMHASPVLRTHASKTKASPETHLRYLQAAQEARRAADMFPPGHHRRNLLNWAEAYERLAARGGAGRDRGGAQARRGR